MFFSPSLLAMLAIAGLVEHYVMLCSLREQEQWSSLRPLNPYEDSTQEWYYSTVALKVTLDTNCFFDYYERDATHLERLIHHAEQGTVELAMTTRVKFDTHDRWQGEDASPIWVKIQSFPLIQTIGTAFRLGMSRLDSGDFLVSEVQSQLIDDLSGVLRQAQPEDIDHVAGHMLGERDLFVTSDKHFLDHSQELLSRFGVLVLTPKDAADRIERVLLV